MRQSKILNLAVMESGLASCHLQWCCTILLGECSMDSAHTTDGGDVYQELRLGSVSENK